VSGEITRAVRLPLFVAAALLAAGCAAGGGSELPAVPDAPPAAKAETDEPLPATAEPLLLDDVPLLLDDGESSATSVVAGADNTRCHVCHLNYVQEDLALIHAKAKVGCVDCHGNCDAHIADESWASGGNGTPPEIMYPRDKIIEFCVSCHPREKPPTKICTDCHGKHRLAERKLKWM